jgi:hypothetical protein
MQIEAIMPFFVNLKFDLRFFIGRIFLLRILTEQLKLNDHSATK